MRDRADNVLTGSMPLSATNMSERQMQGHGLDAGDPPTSTGASRPPLGTQARRSGGGLSQASPIAQAGLATLTQKEGGKGDPPSTRGAAVMPKKTGIRSDLLQV